MGGLCVLLVFLRGGLCGAGGGSNIGGRGRLWWWWCRGIKGEDGEEICDADVDEEVERDGRGECVGWDDDKVGDVWGGM